MLRKLVLVGAFSSYAVTLAVAQPNEEVRRQDAPVQHLSKALPLFGTLRNGRAWDSYKLRFVSERGRVVDTANGLISHSEGQGYGMLLAVAAGDLEAFRRIWAWTRTELRLRDDALVAWRWDPASEKPVRDLNNATDGDLLIAWALIEASYAWPNNRFSIEARRIATDIGRRAVLWKVAGGPLLLPGVSGFSAEERKRGPVINLSYWVFPALQQFSSIAPEYDWARLIGAGLQLVRTARFGADQLPTDWISMGSGAPKPAQGYAAVFSYNAIRIPLYLILAGDMDGSDYRFFAELWEDWRARKLPIVNVDNGETSGSMDEPGYSAVAALTQCAAAGTPLPDWFTLPSESENYYPATLHMLALVAANERYSACLKR